MMIKTNLNLKSKFSVIEQNWEPFQLYVLTIGVNFRYDLESQF